MTTITADTSLALPESYWTKARRTAVVLLGLGVIASVWLTSLASTKSVSFYLGETTKGAHFDVNGKTGTLIFGLLATATAAVLLVTGKRFGLLVGLSLGFFVISALIWQLSNVTISNVPLGSLSKQTMELSIPLIFGAIAGVICERTGVVNVAIEGQLLTGAFFAALFGTIVGSYWAALIAAAIGGALISLILAWLAIRFVVDQVVIGIVLNFFALGLTGFLYEQMMRTDTARFNRPPPFPVWSIPGLSEIPIIGPALFKGTILTWLSLAVVLVTTIALFRTKWGLRTRAVGEHPAAADTVGVKVLGLRYVNVIIAGLVAGLGGSY